MAAAQHWDDELDQLEHPLDVTDDIEVEDPYYDYDESYFDVSEFGLYDKIDEFDNDW